MVKLSILYIFGINTMEIYLELYKVSENQNVFFVYIGKNANGQIGSKSEIHISVFSFVVIYRFFLIFNRSLVIY